MNFLQKLFAGHGANASTAKWACIQYVNFKNKYSNLSDKELLEKIIEFRYKILADDGAKNYILERLGAVQSLTNLTMLVLVAENQNNPVMEDLEYLANVEFSVQNIIAKKGMAAVSFHIE